MSIAGGMLALAAYATWYGLDDLLGRSLAAQAVSVSAGIGVGLGVYLAAAYALAIPELDRFRAMLPARWRT